MKFKTIILLTLFVISCIAQEPRLTYTKEYHDSVVDSIINHYETIIPNLAIIDTIDIWKDDIYFRVRDGRLVLDITKHGYDFWFNFIDTETDKTIHSSFINNESFQTLK